MVAQILSKAWEEQAEQWAAWARKPGHDTYWQFHRDQFFELLPSPAGITLDVGCGEGRLSRDLRQRGYDVKSVDVSPTMVRLAQEADPTGSYQVADAAGLPFPDECAELLVGFMTYQDVDDLPGALREAARVLKPGAQACLAIVHPINSCGSFRTKDPDSEFVIGGTYLESFRYNDTAERDGLRMTFYSAHHSVETYSRAFEAAGLVITAIREHPVPPEAVLQGSASRWQRVPLFMHFRLRK